MTGHEEAGLLADIREHPDEPALRLIHADWLEERGRTAQAEFVRAQCRLAALPRSAPERSPLQEEAQRLLREKWAEWTRPFASLMGTMPNPVAAQFRHTERSIAAYPRGLRESLAVDARVLVQRGGELMDLAPLRHLDLHAPSEAGAALGASRHLRWIETLLVTDRYIGPMDAATMGGLAESPHLGRLRELWLPHNSLGDRGAARLAAAPWLRRVRHLSLSDNGLSAEGAEALARASG
ncbi:MAG: TIGR02996 domain-containing protein, partial [Gemmataceae bacterium]|nr:TIGR02996 domain-containing protein [Gemmataceae bacterium]